MSLTIRQTMGFGVACLMLSSTGIGQERPGQSPAADSAASEALVEPSVSGEIDTALLRAMIEQINPNTTPSPVAYSQPDRGPVGPQPASPILDAATTRVSVQALLTDNKGEPLAGSTVNLSFSVYDGIGAVVDGPIALNNVAIDGGVVSVQVPVSTGSFDGGERKLGMSVNGAAELAPRVPLTAVPYAYRVNRVASEELDDAILLGGPGANGELTVYNNDFGQRETIELDGRNNQIETFEDDGLMSMRAGGFKSGFIELFDRNVEESNDRTVHILAGNTDGGKVFLSDADGARHLSMLGETGTVNLEDGVYMFETLGGELNASLVSGSFGGQLRVTDPLGNNGVLISGNPLTGGGFAEFYQNDGGIGLQLIAEAVTGSLFSMNDSSGGTTITLDSQDVSGGGALASFENSNHDTTISLDADVTDAGEIRMRDATQRNTLKLSADAPGNDIARVTLTDGDSDTLALFSHSNFGSCLEMSDIDGTNTISLFSSWSGGEDGGGRIIIRDPAGSRSIDLNAETGVTKTPVLEITGGADLSEQFDVQGGDALPGTVVCIDVANPGQLIVCDESYNRTVAGIVSGAGGVKTGMLMGQRGSLANGALPVALTGRVYVRADASSGSIQPGDLLTTSDRTGYAMKVSDHNRAQGAIIGKAMTELCDDTGLVLVLVSLQ